MIYGEPDYLPQRMPGVRAVLAEAISRDIYGEQQVSPPQHIDVVDEYTADVDTLERIAERLRAA